jgi:hypothetical protein
MLRRCLEIQRVRYPVIAIEGVELRARTIPKQLLASIWMILSDDPFPKVKAFQLEDADFDRAMKLKQCNEDERRELMEWGRVLPIEGTDACVFNADEMHGVDYVILIRKSHYHDFKEVLKHELSHIARGDL